MRTIVTLGRSQFHGSKRLPHFSAFDTWPSHRLLHGRKPAYPTTMMQMAVLPPVVVNARFDYFDIVAIVWLIIGLLWGRKKGMSQELLPLFQWIGIVTAGGLLYKPFSAVIHQCTQFGPLWSNITAYLVIALGVHLLYIWFKQMFAEKLTKKDLFGGGEFYLGMLAGMVRFGCMLLFCMALMNSRVATATELAQTEKFQKDWFSDIRFPTYGEFQQDVLFKSLTGNLVQAKFKVVLIASVSSAPAPKMDTIAQRNNKAIDDILAQPGKR
jgi:uncharacterized membrane protein required for colicin V production